MIVSRSSRRRGISSAEMAVAFALFAIAVAMAGQLSGFVSMERMRTAARQDAVEQCANVLERARSVPWKELTPEWAAKQKLSAGHLLPQGSLQVVVSRVKDEPKLKKVDATAKWMMERETEATMSAWFRDREEAK
jgi:Tfp pilus assembly protein FimT